MMRPGYDDLMKTIAGKAMANIKQAAGHGERTPERCKVLIAGSAASACTRKSSY
jgi:hypothetical protein